MDRPEWPPLPFAPWRETCTWLHMALQRVGKMTLATTPLVNHWWNTAFHYTARGLATQPMAVGGGRTLVAEFDFVSHELVLTVSDGARASLPLSSRPIAQFHDELNRALDRAGIAIPVWTLPVECESPIPFERDHQHRTYDAAHAAAFWRALEAMRPVFERFRAGFVGKCSPVHFFWGAPDLALTRFSGRRAPDDPAADAVMREAYSHEVISHGFWAGGSGYDACFYAYARPEPPGFPKARIAPMFARYDEPMAEFLLPYEAVRTSADPEATLMAFLESTYGAAADLAGWDRTALERNG